MERGNRESGPRAFPEWKGEQEIWLRERFQHGKGNRKSGSERGCMTDKEERGAHLSVPPFRSGKGVRGIGRHLRPDVFSGSPSPIFPGEGVRG